jgi:hypothetical protein
MDGIRSFENIGEEHEAHHFHLIRHLSHGHARRWFKSKCVNKMKKQAQICRMIGSNFKYFGQIIFNKI